MLILWIALAVIFLLLDFFKSYRPCLWLFIGSVGALIVNFLGLDFVVNPMFTQIAVFAVGIVLALFMPKLVRKARKESRPITNVDRLKGLNIQLTKQAEYDNPGETLIGDVEWAVVPKHKGTVLEEGTICKVVRIKGTRLVVIVAGAKDRKRRRKIRIAEKLEQRRIEKELKEKRIQEAKEQKAKDKALKEAEKQAKKDSKKAKKAHVEPTEEKIVQQVIETKEEVVEEKVEEPVQEEKVEEVVEETTEEAIEEEPVQEEVVEEVVEEATEEVVEEEVEEEPVQEEVVEEVVEEATEEVVEEEPVQEEKVEEVTEEVVEEEPVQEEKVEEVTEEVVEEEPVQEAAAEENQDDNQEAPTEEKEDIPDKEIVEKDGKQVLAIYRKSMGAKVALAHDNTKQYYVDLANYIAKYKGVRRQDSWEFTSYYKWKNIVLKLAVKGKTLFLYTSLPFEEYKEQIYYLKESKSKVHKNTPTVLHVKSDRSFKYAKELIDIVMVNKGATYMENCEAVETLDKYQNKTREQLLEEGLIKIVYSDIK